MGSSHCCTRKYQIMARQTLTQPSSCNGIPRRRRKRRSHRTVWFAVLFLHAITTGESLPHGLLVKDQSDKTAGERFREELIQVLQGALSDASYYSDSRLESLQGKKPGEQQWRRRWERFRRACSKAAKSSTGVASVAGDPLLASTAMAAASVERELKGPAETQDMRNRIRVDGGKKKTASRVEKKGRKQKTGKSRRVESEVDVETVEGARLISASFGFVADTFGLLADGVRVVGDTAAGVTGSSVKLMGTAVKTMSSGLDSAGRALEPNQNGSNDEAAGRRSQLTSERLINRKRGLPTDYGRRKGGVLGNTRQVAAKSVRLLGKVVRGVGDSLVLAGAATESVASSTVGVAEDAVRIVENFAGSVSFALMPRRYLIDDDMEMEEVDDDDFDMERDFEGEEPTFVSYGTYADKDQPMYQDSAPALAPSLVHRLRTSEGQSTIMIVIDLIVEQTRDFFSFIMADTEGAPTFATELLGVMFLCYLSALFLSGKPKARPRRESAELDGVPAKHETERTVQPTPKRVAPEIDTDSGDSDSASDLDSLPSSKDHAHVHRSKRFQDIKTEKGFLTRDALRVMKNVFYCPVRLLIRVSRFLCDKFVSRSGALLFVYVAAWLYLCRLSQIRSISIHRNGETKGFHTAVSSIGTTSPSVAESVVWLNALVSQMWRVPYDPASKTSQKWARERHSYPKFVTRVIEQEAERKFGRQDVSSATSSYGGLEPYISSSLGKSLFNVLDSSKTSRPNDVAYVSLYSLTLGGKPPLLRSMELHGVKQAGRVTQFLLDVDAVLDDFSLVVEIKLSSLEYALLPSTKVSINSLEMRAPLQVSLSSRPDYPFVSKLRMSLAHAPECKVRITPLSDDSGLRGVDLGSLPVINDWVREVIRESLSEYVSPKYVAVNIGELLSVSGRKQSATPAPTRPDITQLRQKTKETLNTNPRTSSASGVSMTSVADFLPSLHSATKVAGEQPDKPARPPYLVRPKTELAQLGMERWTAKSAHDVHKGTSHGGLVGALAKPITLVTPFVLAIAAGVFRDRLVEEDELPKDEGTS